MKYINEEITQLMNHELSIHQKKNELIKLLEDCLRNDAFLNDENLKLIEENWQILTTGKEFDHVDMQLENIYQQLIKNFKKKKEKVVFQIQGREVKETLLEQLTKLVDSNEWKQVNDELRNIKHAWNDAIYAGEEYDAKLNRKFQELYDKIVEGKDQYFHHLQEGLQSAKAKKEELITKAKELSNSSNWKQTSQMMKGLMEEWKRVGYAGREMNDLLWEQFNTTRQHFFQRQEEYFEKAKEQQAQSLIAKKELVTKIQAIDQDEDMKETSIKMRELMNEWKKAGYAGSEDQKLWEIFSKCRQDFYQRQQAYYELKKSKYVDDLYEGIKRRNQQINDLETQIKTLEASIREVRNQDPMIGNDHEKRKEVMAQRAEEIQRYQEYINHNYTKINAIKDELSEMNDKYETLTKES